MATTSRATGVPLPIPTLMIIKEITSLNILYAALVSVSLFCIFQIGNAFPILFSRRRKDFAGLGKQKRYQWFEPCPLCEGREAIQHLALPIWTSPFRPRKKGSIWTDGGSGCEDFAGLGKQKRYQWFEPCPLCEGREAIQRLALPIWTSPFRPRKKGSIWTDVGSGCVFAEKGVKYYLSSRRRRIDFAGLGKQKRRQWFEPSPLSQVGEASMRLRLLILAVYFSRKNGLAWTDGGSVERNNYSRSRPGNSISRPPQKLELVKIVDKLFAKCWAHIGNGGTELKAYKKLRTTHQGKHGHNVGSTAFRNWAQGGDGSGEERTIQDDWGSPDTAVNSSVQMTSPPRKTTPQTQPPPTPPPPQTPPSPTLRASPQVQPPTPAPQVQPPSPTPTPAPAPPPPPPPPPRGWFNFNFSGWFTFNFTGWFNFNVTDLAKIFLAISATLVIAPPQIVHSGGNSLSANDKTLLFGTKLFGLAGFIFCLLAYMIGQANIAAKLLIAFGVVADIFGLLLVVALGR